MLNEPDTKRLDHLGRKPEISVSRETTERLEVYLGLLQQWQARINLVANSTLEDAWARHIQDSLQLLAYLGEAETIVDMGSGAGFPGMVLAIALAEREEEAHVHLVEASAKKCAFLRAVSRETALNDRRGPFIHNARIEDVIGTMDDPDIVTARALAPLDRLFDYGEEWLTPCGKALFQKGQSYRQEIVEARKRWDFDVICHQSMVASDSIIVEITKLKRR